MNHALNPNSPEALLEKANASLEARATENVSLKADLAKLKGELATAKAEAAKLRTAAATATAAAKASAASAASAPAPTGNVLTRAERDALYAQMEKLPEAERRGFYERAIRGKAVV